MNIEGIHISVDGLRISPDISSVLDKYEIKNYADLEREFINQNSEIINNYFLNSAYFDFKNSVGQQNETEKVYDDYLKMSDKKESLGLNIADVDKMVKVTDLPLFVSHPKLVSSAACSSSPDSVSNHNIADLKMRMSYTFIRNGETVPWIIGLGISIGEVKYNQIMASLKFYDSYVATLLEKYPDQENPFYYMHDEKLSLVREKRKEIFEYLNDTGYEFVFGKVEPVMKVLDARWPSTQSKKKLFDIEEVIANYVTVDEVVNITSPKVLNKFIVPYGKR